MSVVIWEGLMEDVALRQGNEDICHSFYHLVD